MLKLHIIIASYFFIINDN